MNLRSELWNGLWAPLQWRLIFMHIQVIFQGLQMPLLLHPGAAAFLTASTSDGAGNIKVSHSLPIIGDNTPPLLSNLKCTKHASTRQGLVTCEWDKVIEYESIVKDILISIGTKPQLGDVIRDFKQSLTKLEYSRDLTTYLKKNLEVTSLYIDFKVINVVGRINEYEHKIIVDRTPPIVQGVHVVTRTNDNMPYTTMRCQLPTSFIEISVESFEDAESGIDENRLVDTICTNTIGFKDHCTRYITELKKTHTNKLKISDSFD